ncbi:MAG: hypothetical protein CMJ08_03405 [Pelagibacterales bacterium]|nr:hypothetical protein [Pelagibacterales bacterium]
MNIKFLKFIVIFMGILIVIGVLVLGMSIYIKFKNISNINNKNHFIINMPDNMNFLGHDIFEDKIYISYKSSNKIIIKIYSLITGRAIKEIEILK